MIGKNNVILLLIFVLVNGCKPSSDSPEQTATVSEKEETPVLERGENAEWKQFESETGKKPAEVGLMTPSLKSRLKNLLKDEYPAFEKDWNNESAIEISDRILFTSGCQAGDCAANKYILILDIGDNNINVINFKYGRVRSWEERAVIGLPEKLLNLFENIRKDQGL
jgi:hypothetical protein